MDPDVTDIAKSELTEPQPTRRGPWKFWGTALWGVAIAAAWIICGALATALTLIRLAPPTDFSQDELRAFVFSHDEVLISAIGSGTIGAFAMLALAVWLSRVSLRDYLGLKLPRPRDLIIGFCGLVLLYVPLAIAGYFFGPLQSSKYMINLYHSAVTSGRLPLLAAALIVLAPVSEEILIRGFLLPGWAASWIRPGGAIILTAALWALLHRQYEVITMVDVFAIGLLLGWIRQRSGSTLATILLHATQNAAALALVAIFYPPG
jgi:membrane protease YdiL (CAAX protease family)